MHVLALSGDGSQTRIRWYVSHEEALGDVSLIDLVEIMRDGLATGSTDDLETIRGSR